VWNSGPMTGLIARVALAAFVGFLPIVLDAPVAIASPHTLDCVPVGVTKDHEGIVWADKTATESGSSGT
jgi:hypothetical protein